jgi:ferredoxin
MRKVPNIQARRLHWIALAAGVLLLVALVAVVRSPPANPAMFWALALGALLVGAAIAGCAHSSFSLFLEVTTIGLAWLMFKGEAPADSAFLYLPLVAAVAISVSAATSPVLSPILATALTTGWFALAGGVLRVSGGMQWFFLAATVLMLAVFAASIVPRPRGVPRHLDVLLCSYSSNTAHYTGIFTAAATNAGAKVAVHRFHHYRGFTARYEGDALVVAFPVIGWKPPWPLLYYLMRGLPRGGGKPAYVIYTAAGGPENAGMLTWLVLTIKGYRVAGRSLGVYPLNVPTLRIGPKGLWRWIDSLTPFAAESRGATEAGGDFVEGRDSGLPFILWPFFLSIVGVLVDNPVVNRIYRNHAFKRRCSGCGACVDYCPAERLRMINGRPRAAGTCALCLGCVNICPTNAMQMWFFTEYGRPYRPKWPSLVMKKRADETRPASDSAGMNCQD